MVPLSQTVPVVHRRVTVTADHPSLGDRYRTGRRSSDLD